MIFMKQKFALIPRVRVNYTYTDIVKAFFCSEQKNEYRQKTINILQSYFSNRNVLLTSSGRSGLYLILRSLPQKKVIIPAYTCPVVQEAIVLAGKQILYAPTSDKTFNMCQMPQLDEDSILIATHQYGIPCDIEEMVARCDEMGAILIEDCAASLGTTVNGIPVGMFGHYAFFSFDASKLVNVPSKGGFILAKSQELLEAIQTEDLLPSTIKYKFKHLCRGLIYCSVKSPYLYRIFHYLTMGMWHKMHISEDNSNGINAQLSDFYTHGFYEWQAIIAVKQLQNLQHILTKRKKVYKYYHENICNQCIEKPPYNEEASCIRYTIMAKNQKTFYENCLRQGVDMGFSFNHITSPDFFEKEHSIAKQILNIPFYYDISEKEMREVVNVVNSTY